MIVLVIAFTSAILKGLEFYELESVALLYGTSVTLPLLDDNDRFEYSNPMHNFNKINNVIYDNNYREINDNNNSNNNVSGNDGRKKNSYDIDSNDKDDNNNNNREDNNDDDNDSNSNKYKNESYSACNSDIDYESKDDDDDDYNDYGISENKIKESENFLFINPMHKNKTFDNDKNSENFSISNKSTPIKSPQKNSEKNEVKKLQYISSEKSISIDTLSVKNTVSLDNFDAKNNSKVNEKNTEKKKSADTYLDKRINTDFSTNEYNTNEYDSIIVDNTKIKVPYSIIFAILGMWLLYAVLYVTLELSTKCTWGYFLLLTV